MSPDAATPAPHPTAGLPIYLVPGDGGDHTAEPFLPAGLRWADDGANPVADAVELLGGMDADRAALGALTGFAGLERLLVWARALSMAETGPVGVRIGRTADRQLSWLRRVQGPAQLSDLLDLVDPRVDRHRSMPDAFGDRSRRARLLESMWEWGRSWQRVVDAGRLRLRAGGAAVDPTVASVAAWIGVDVADPGARAPRLTLADLGPGGDGARLYRMRVRAPLHVAEAADGGEAGRRKALWLDDGADPADLPGSPISVAATPRGVVVQVRGFSRRFDAPAVLDVCDMEKVRVAPPDTWEDGWGDILVWFRADPARLP